MSQNRTKSGTEVKYDPDLATRVGKKLLGEFYTEENLNNWNNSEITLFRYVIIYQISYLVNQFLFQQNVGAEFSRQLVRHWPVYAGNQDLRPGLRVQQAGAG